MNQRMTITKNDFFTANNFETLQDIGKKYPEWKDFCMEIVNQFDDKFGVTMLSETSGELKQLLFLDQNIAEHTPYPGITASELQKDRLYLYKFHAEEDSTDMTLKSSELYNTGVNIKPLTFIFNENTMIDGKWSPVITIQSDDTFNVGDTLLSLESYISNEQHNDIRMDYNGAMYEVAKVEGKKVYLLTKDEVNTLIQETQALYLYNKAK